MIYFKNPAGLCADLLMHPIISCHALRSLHLQVTKGGGSPELKELLAVLRTLPVRNDLCVYRSDFPRKNNFTEIPNRNDYVKTSMAGILVAGIFKSNTPAPQKEHKESPTPEGLGWTHAADIAKLAKKVQEELVALDIDLSEKQVAAAQRAIKKSATWTFVELSADSMLEADTCAVYLVDGKGFVNDKGNPVPLSGARLFESSAAAQRTIQSRGWVNAVIVNAKVRVEGLGLDQRAMPNNLGMLGEALAHRQAEDLLANTPLVEEAAPAARRGRL